MASFTERLAQRWSQADTLLCVGLDPDLARFPAHLRQRDDAIYAFCRAIVDATAEFACAFKPQIAYFAAARAEDQLERLIAHCHSAPFMGFDSIEPYLAYADRGAFLLCRTSNAGGNDLQMLDVGGEKLFERVARLADSTWNRNGQLGLVVGATYPAELARVRALAPSLPLLVPGIGAQGGDVQASVQAGRDARGAGMVINSSRAILYAGSGEDFAVAAASAARHARDEINRYRAG